MTDKMGVSKRISSIDLFRIYAMFCVVAIHAFAFWPFKHVYGPTILFSRFAVPFFFIAAGYFFTLKISKNNEPLKTLFLVVKRLYLIYVVWCCIYIIAPVIIPKNWDNITQFGLYSELTKQFYWAVLDIQRQPLLYLYEGAGSTHLWFLPALACGLALLAFGIRFNQFKLFLLLAFTLYVIALLGKTYWGTPWGLHLSINMRHGPFFSTVFVAIGAWLARSNFKTRMGPAIAILVAGYGIQYMEAFLLNKFDNNQVMWGQEFLIGTLLFGTGFILVALAAPSLGEKTGIAKLGRYVLGVYVLHILVRDFIQPVNHYLPFYYISWTIATFIVSLILAMILARIPVLKRIII